MKKLGDHFRFLATAIVIFLTSSPAVAGTDLSVGATFRSYPLSGVVEIDGGYDFLLWGSNAAGVPWYGYLRPRLEGSSALTYNEVGGGVEFFPISFLGLRAGGEGIQNDQNYSAYDCMTYVCRGRFYRTYVQAELSMGFGRLYAQARWGRERWTTADPARGRFVEPTAGLALAGAGDSETLYRGLVGMKLWPNWSVAGVLVYSLSDMGHGNSRFPFLVVRYTSGPLSIGVGGGVFQSDLKPDSGSGLVFLRWDVKPSLALQ